MKLLYEFGVIMAVTFLGEICHAVLPFPIPASIYGLLLMLFALCTKIIKLEQVKVAGDFLLDIMPPMFIPAGVGLLTAWPDLKPVLVPVLVITVVVTVFVMVVTGRVSQRVIWMTKEKRGGEVMASFFEESLFFGMAVSLIAYGLGLLLKKKLKWAFLNPLLLSIIVVILFLQVLP